VELTLSRKGSESSSLMVGFSVVRVTSSSRSLVCAAVLRDSACSAQAAAELAEQMNQPRPTVRKTGGNLTVSCLVSTLCQDLFIKNARRRYPAMRNAAISEPISELT
jgi:hypothetical protein